MSERVQSILQKPQSTII